METSVQLVLVQPPTIHGEGGGGYKTGGGACEVLPLRKGGGAKSFGPAIYPFCSPPLPVPPTIPLKSYDVEKTLKKVLTYSGIYIFIIEIQSTSMSAMQPTELSAEEKAPILNYKAGRPSRTKRSRSEVFRNSEDDDDGEHEGSQEESPRNRRFIYNDILESIQVIV